MEACEIFSQEWKLVRFVPTKKLGRRFLEWKLVRFFSHKNLGRRFLEWKLVRFFSHKKFRGKVPGMETCEIFFPHKNEKEQVPRM